MGKSEFIDSWHARFGVRRQLVADIAKRATGHELVDAQRVRRGVDNEVYRVLLDDETPIFVRITRPDDGHGFRNEAWAMGLGRDAGVPVPDVLAIDVVATENGERQTMVLSNAPGRHLDSILESLTPQERNAVMQDIGRVLATAHSVSLPGIWRPEDDGTWPDPAAVRRGYLAECLASPAKLVAAGLSEPEVEQTVALLDASWDAGTPNPSDTYVLCHGDISPEHVFVDTDLRVCALIDWGMWHGGTAITDLANAAGVLSTSDFTAIVEGHGAGSSREDEFRRRLTLSIVSQSIGHIGADVDMGDIAGAQPRAAAIRRALAELVTRERTR